MSEEPKPTGASSTTVSVAITLSLMLLTVPPIWLFEYSLHAHHEGRAFQSLELWLLAAAACFIRGLFIWRSHRRLALCCFAVVMLQLPFLFFPLILLLIWLSGGHI
jgi:hypothetical protein